MYHIINTDEYADASVTGQRMQHGFSAISPVVLYFPPLHLLGQLSSVCTDSCAINLKLKEHMVLVTLLYHHLLMLDKPNHIISPGILKPMWIDINKWEMPSTIQASSCHFNCSSEEFNPL
jgi:hypothetical protein